MYLEKKNIRGCTGALKGPHSIRLEKVPSVAVGRGGGVDDELLKITHSNSVTRVKLEVK